ncbi:MAG: polysaccharide biosynthesis protein [Lachnospiraceae bacterium]
MTKQSKQNLLMQGSILAAAGIITRLIGLLYRVPMANMLGAEGNGLYSVAFGIYNITLTLSSYGLPLAVSKIISQRTANKEYRNANHVFHNALLLALILGSIACAAIYLGADTLEIIYSQKGLAKPLRIVAPTTFVMALLGVFRGLYQGKHTMIPTAISQIVEQIVNVMVSLLAVYQFTQVYRDSDQVAAYGAAGGMCGTFAGALIALIFVIIIFILYKPTLDRQVKRDRTAIDETNLEIYRVLAITVLPIIISQTVYQIGSTIDDYIFANVMPLRGLKQSLITSLQGVYNTQFNLLINIPVAVATSLAASAMPSIAASYKRHEISEIVEKIHYVIKFNMMIAFPSAVGLSVLALPIMKMLFPAISEYHDLSANLLLVGSSAVIFYSLSTITSSILQGTDHMKTPIYHAAISLVIHLFLVYPLLRYTDLNVYALVIGSITFPMVICILNWISVGHFLGYRQEVVKSFLVPLVSSLVMGLVAVGIYQLTYFLLSNNTFSVIVSILLGAMVYFFMLLILKCFSKEEVLNLPFGYRIAKICKHFL